uniref:Uncharacterized protein n=1 Tax=Oryza punctata TaxID=4537 RepID=A0A0E0M6T9_ORYPU
MGNCQAADAAAVVIQHPSSSSFGNGGGGGRVERAYGALSAAAVMAANPGHYVAEVVRPVATAPATASAASAPAARRRLKLLRPDDTLVLGGVYRLVTFEDVLKQFVSKRNATMSRATTATAAAAADYDDDGHRRRGSSGGGGAEVTAQSHQEDLSSPSPTNEAHPESEPEPEPEPEPDLVAAAMALGGRMSLSRHGQWRPALPSIAEGSVVC